MIIQSRNFFFAAVTRIETPAFKCTISTAKEGIFKPLSTMIIEGDTVNERTKTRTCGKFIYSKALRNKDILKFHNVLAEIIDKAGDDGLFLGDAIDLASQIFKEKGLISEAVNLYSSKATDPNNGQKIETSNINDEDAHENTAIKNLSNVIIDTTLWCGESMKEWINNDYGKESKKAEQKRTELILKILSFFLHITNRIVFGKNGIGEKKGKAFQNKLLPLIIDSFVENVCGAWLQKDKDKIIDNLFAEINKAELEYSNCTSVCLGGGEERSLIEILATGQTRKGLINQLSDNIAKLVSGGPDIIITEHSKIIVLEAYSRIYSDLGTLVAEAGKELS